MKPMHEFWMKTPLWDAPNEGEPGGTVDPAEPDFSFVPEQFRADGNLDWGGFRTHYDDVIAEKAIRDEAMADVPEDGKYEWALPDKLDFGELELPEDFAVNLRTDDPAFAPLFEELGGIFHKHNMPKGAAGEVLGVLAKYRATEYSQAVAASNAEMQALGTAAQSRISNIGRMLDSRLPADEAAALKAATTTANGVRALERLFKPRGPITTPSQPQGMNENMSPLERLRAANEAQHR